MNTPVCLELSILDLSQAVTYEFWYDYLKTKIGWKCKSLLYGYRQLHCSCKNRWYLQSHCRRCSNKIWQYKCWNRQTITKLKKQKSNWTDELGGKIMKTFVWLRVKTFSYLNDNNDEDRKANGTKKCIIKRNLKFRDYKKYLK